MKQKGGNSNRQPVDYTQRDRGKERIMHKEHNVHISWKDRLRKEREGYNNSVVRAIDMDIIGSVPVDQNQHLKIFQQPEQYKKYQNEFEQITSNRRRVQNLTTLERKEKLIEFLNEQRRLPGGGLRKEDSFERQKQMQQIMSQLENAPLVPQSQRSSHYMLPPLIQKNAQSVMKNYYLAHSLDLSQPDYYHVSIQDGMPDIETRKQKLGKDPILQLEKQTLIDPKIDFNSPLQKNTMKIQNSLFSPDDFKQSYIESNRMKQQPKLVKKYQTESKDSPFSVSFAENPLNGPVKAVQEEQESKLQKRTFKSIETLAPVTQRAQTIQFKEPVKPELKVAEQIDFKSREKRLLEESQRVAHEIEMAQSPQIVSSRVTRMVNDHPKASTLQSQMATLENELNRHINKRASINSRLQNDLPPSNDYGMSPQYYTNPISPPGYITNNPYYYQTTKTNSGDGQNGQNVLFEPEIYRQPEDEQMIQHDDEEDRRSVSTHAGANASMVSNYKTGLDPTLFQANKIRCCMCGVMMVPNESNTCIQCLKSQIDITEGIPKQLVLYHCRECSRYLRPPWTHAALESAELLAICLKHVKGLKRVKLIDAGFVWTEPHSRRIKVKLTVQKEVLNGTLLQQSFVIEFIVTNQQCDDCKKTYTPHLWVAQVQVRQRVDHKRTFLFLEQLIIKHNAAEKCMNIREMHDGLDFQFKNKSHANRLVDFISSQVPSRFKQSKQLISHDMRNNNFNFKYTFSQDIAPICRDDLVVLPKQLSKELGGLGPIVLVYKISTFVQVVDVFTMRTYEIDQNTYWKYHFTALCGRDRLTEFVVLNIENTDYDVNVSRAAAKQRFKMVQVEVARVQDFGHNDKTFIVNTHLGETLNYNDHVLGYDLDAINLMQLDQLDIENENQVPPIVLVKKTYPRFRKRQKHRLWKLKHLEKDAAGEEEGKGKRGAAKDSMNKHQKDYEMFIQDIEEDPELRGQIDLYRNEDVINELERKLAGIDLDKVEEKKSAIQSALDKGKAKVGSEERKVGKAARKTEKGREIKAESEEARKKQELLIKATLKEKGTTKEDDSDSGYESIEEDFPHIKLDDLKTLEDQLAGMQIEGEDDEDQDDDDFEDVEDDEQESNQKKGASKAPAKKEEFKKPAQKK